jgi:Co/Zn/Cd efflux system component
MPVMNTLVKNMITVNTASYENEDEALKDDLSTHSAYLHVLGDALSSAGVTAAALDIWKTG